MTPVVPVAKPVGVLVGLGPRLGQVAVATVPRHGPRLGTALAPSLGPVPPLVRLPVSPGATSGGNIVDGNTRLGLRGLVVVAARVGVGLAHGLAPSVRPLAVVLGVALVAGRADIPTTLEVSGLAGGRRPGPLAVPCVAPGLGEGAKADETRRVRVDARPVGPSIRRLAVALEAVDITFRGVEKVADVVTVGLVTRPP